MNPYSEQIKNNNDAIQKLKEDIRSLEQENNLLMRLHYGHEIITHELNDSQKAAVEQITGNNIIIACPGSGKTHTLISKIVYMIKNNNIDPYSIILITFTKRSGKELYVRLKKKLANINLHHIGTIHSLAYRTLQKYDDINYTILDENETNKSILLACRKILNDIDMSDNVRSTLERNVPIIYNRLISQFPITLSELLKKYNIHTHLSIVKEIIDEYNKFKQEKNYLDFSDLMYRFDTFLKESRSQSFLSKIRYILFDEYQDINAIQNSILYEMNRYCQNLTVVGDDSQSIYSFRGSEVKHIINFNDIYDNVNNFNLSINYRSTPSIISFCNDIISQNNVRIDKNMIAHITNTGNLPNVIGFTTKEEEVNFIIKMVKENVKLGIKLKEQAIIVRKNKQIDDFELTLIKNKINYTKNHGLGILDRIHIKDFLAFLIVIENPKSTLHWKRILSMINGVGNVSINKIVDNDENIMENIIKNNYPPKLSGKIAILSDLFKKINRNKDDYNAVCDSIIEFLMLVLKSKKASKNVNRKHADWLTLKEYVIDSSSISTFLSDIYLGWQMIELETKENIRKGNNDSLLLSTIHGAKGLEWDTVFVAGCSSDNMPFYKKNIYLEELDWIEEERRLFYVACSRAKTNLIITMSYKTDYQHSSIFTSPFITNINKTLYEGSNIQIPYEIKEGDITFLIKSYLMLKGTHAIYPILKTLPYTFHDYYKGYINNNVYKNNLEMIYGTFIDNLLIKIVHQHYKDIMEPLDIGQYEKFNIKKDKAYHEYVDTNNDWKDCIKSILTVSSKKNRITKGRDNFYKDITNSIDMALYNQMEELIITLVEQELNEKKIIKPHFNISFSNFMGEADMVVNNTLFEFKASKDIIATTKYVLQVLLYTQLLKKKGIIINKIILLNPILGESYNFDLDKWNNDNIDKIWNILTK